MIFQLCEVVKVEIGALKPENIGNGWSWYLICDSRNHGLTAVWFVFAANMCQPSMTFFLFSNPVNNMAFEPACKSCQLIMSFLSTDFFSETWPKWPMCFARKIPQPFSPNFWDPFGVGNGYAVGPEPTEPCGPAWSCGKWEVEQMERGQGHFGGLLSNSRSFVIMVRWYNEAVVWFGRGFDFRVVLHISFVCKNVSSKDMVFSAGTAEGRQFVFEKGQTTMTSQLAMASSSLLVSGCQRFNRCLTGVGKFHSDGWFIDYIHPSNTEMEHGNAWTFGQFLHYARCGHTLPIDSIDDLQQTVWNMRPPCPAPGRIMWIAQWQLIIYNFYVYMYSIVQ